MVCALVYDRFCTLLYIYLLVLGLRVPVPFRSGMTSYANFVITGHGFSHSAPAATQVCESQPDKTPRCPYCRRMVDRVVAASAPRLAAFREAASPGPQVHPAPPRREENATEAARNLPAPSLGRTATFGRTCSRSQRR